LKRFAEHNKVMDKHRMSTFVNNNVRMHNSQLRMLCTTTIADPGRKEHMLHNGGLSGAAVSSSGELGSEGCLAFCGHGWRAAGLWVQDAGLGLTPLLLTANKRSQ